jgi:hypothetical protein
VGRSHVSRPEQDLRNAETRRRRLSVLPKAPEGAQEVLVEADPGRFFRPPYVGHRGWIGIQLDKASDWVDRLIRQSYPMTAPKRLALAPEAS